MKRKTRRGRKAKRMCRVDVSGVYLDLFRGNWHGNQVRAKKDIKDFNGRVAVRKGVRGIVEGIRWYPESNGVWLDVVWDRIVKYKDLPKNAIESRNLSQPGYELLKSVTVNWCH